MRQGPRSQHTPLTLAFVALLNEKLKESDVTSVHQLAKLLDGKITRTHVYALMDGSSVMDLAEMEAISDALGLRSTEVYLEAWHQTHQPQDPAEATDMA